jgi:hypothetical protein
MSDRGVGGHPPSRRRRRAARRRVSAAVRIAAAGDALLALSVTMRLIDAFAHRPAQTLPAPSRLASLTVPERDILLWLAAV